MSATLSQRFGQRLGSSFAAGRPVLKGVCAALADRAGVPVWMPRAAFVLFALLHWVLATILYIVLTDRMCRVVRRAPAPYAAPPPNPFGVRDCLSALDARLADLEAATLQQEAGLRRQFRDLERG